MDEKKESTEGTTPVDPDLYLAQLSKPPAPATQDVDPETTYQNTKILPPLLKKRRNSRHRLPFAP